MGTYIYAYWEEQESNDHCGWYLAKILSVHPDGAASLKYRKDNTTEDVSLNEIRCITGSGRGKWFLPPSHTPPEHTCASTPQPTFSSAHKVKGFADDLTVLSSSKGEHEDTLSDVNNKCKDIGLEIRADKCVSMVFDGHEVKKKIAFKVGSGLTRNITDGATKFLGSTFATSSQATKKQAGKILLESFLGKLTNLDKAPIRGEYKLWIYKRYLTQSFRLSLSVNPIPSTIISKMQSTSMKLLKRWLGLTQSTTVAVIHHPDVLGVPFLPQLQTKAKLTFLSSVVSPNDPMIQELTKTILEETTASRLGISSESLSVLNQARESVESISRKTLSTECRKISDEVDKTHWDNKLASLSVQGKFHQVCQLEAQNQVWNRIMVGLPAGQLLRAGSDTLPTPLNLKRWMIRVDAKCDLCGDLCPTVLHILNGCPVALNHSRYTWRYDSVLKKYDQFVRPQLSTDECLYTDLPGLRAQENPSSTIPLDLVVTTARPDMVYICNNTVVLIELTIPFNSPESLKHAQSRKQNKQLYQQLLSDLDSAGKQATLVTIEIGSLGHSLPSCHKSLVRSLPNIFEKSMVRTLFDNAAKTAISASYVIYLARKNNHWPTDKTLLS